MPSDDPTLNPPPAEEETTPAGMRLRKRARRAVAEADEATEAPNPVRRRRRRFTLNMLPDMPLDIILEIFGHLHPSDLLSLARSTKPMRSLLMHRSAKTIWKAARRNVPDLPDCPECFDEPQYAALMFGTCCTFCGKSPIRDVDWESLARCCPECRQDPKMFRDISSLGYSVRQLAKALLPHIIRSTKLFVRPDQFDLLNHYVDKKVSGESGDQALLDLCHCLTKARWDPEAIQPLRDWHHARAAERANQRDELRQQRRAAILEKLAELDLKEEVERMEEWVRDTFDGLPCMKEPKALTDREWDKIKDSVVTFVENCRRNRLQRELTAPYYATIRALLPHLNAFARSRPHTDILPTLTDFCEHPDVRAMVLEVAGTKSELDADAFKALIPVVCQWWREKADDVLVKKLPPSRPGTEALELAAVWFKCTECLNMGNNVFGYPEVLTHDLHRSTSSCNGTPKEPEELVQYVVRDTCVVGLFKFEEFAEKLEVSAEVSQAASDIVRLCGLDPASATREDMDDLNARVACVACQTIFPWHKAALHAAQKKHADSPRWVLLNDIDNRTIKAIETKDRTRVTKHPLWCLHCRYFQRPDAMNSWGAHRGMAKLKFHLEMQHNFTSRPKLGIDYRIHKYPNEPERPRPVIYDAAKMTVTTPELVDAWTRAAKATK